MGIRIGEKRPWRGEPGRASFVLTGPYPGNYGVDTPVYQVSRYITTLRDITKKSVFPPIVTHCDKRLMLGCGLCVSKSRCERGVSGNCFMTFAVILAVVRLCFVYIARSQRGPIPLQF